MVSTVSKPRISGPNWPIRATKHRNRILEMSWSQSGRLRIKLSTQFLVKADRSPKTEVFFISQMWHFLTFEARIEDETSFCRRKAARMWKYNPLPPLGTYCRFPDHRTISRSAVSRYAHVVMHKFHEITFWRFLSGFKPGQLDFLTQRQILVQKPLSTFEFAFWWLIAVVVVILSHKILFGPKRKISSSKPASDHRESQLGCKIKLFRPICNFWGISPWTDFLIEHDKIWESDKLAQKASFCTLIAITGGQRHVLRMKFCVLARNIFLVTKSPPTRWSAART